MERHFELVSNNELHRKRAVMTWAGKEGPDQTAHSRSLIRALLACLQYIG